MSFYKNKILPLRKKYGGGTNEKRHEKKAVKTLRLGLWAVWLWSSSQRFAWLSLWPGANHFLLNLSFSICQHGKFGSHITWAFYGVWPSVTLSVLYFSYFPQVKEQSVDLLRGRLSPKSMLCLACWNFFGRQLPPGTGLCILRACHSPPQFRCWNGPGILWRPLFWIGEGHGDIGISAWG